MLLGCSEYQRVYSNSSPRPGLFGVARVAAKVLQHKQYESLCIDDTIHGMTIRFSTPAIPDSKRLLSATASRIEVQPTVHLTVHAYVCFTLTVTYWSPGSFCHFQSPLTCVHTARTIASSLDRDTATPSSRKWKLWTTLVTMCHATMLLRFTEIHNKVVVVWWLRGCLVLAATIAQVAWRQLWLPCPHSVPWISCGPNHRIYSAPIAQQVTTWCNFCL